MKKQFILTCFSIFTVSVLMLLAGCVVVSFGNNDTSREASVQAHGERGNYDIITGAFNKIKIEGNCEIRYNSGNSDTVTLLVQPNAREFITVETVNEELIVKTTKKISYGMSKGPVLTVYAPALNQVTIEGAGVFKSNDKITGDSLVFNINGAGSGDTELDVNNLAVTISGAGKMDLTGKAQNSSIILSGAGNYNALSLQTSDTTVSMLGAGSVKVHSTGKLRINAEGAGSVEYKGSPILELNTSGLISIRNVN